MHQLNILDALVIGGVVLLVMVVAICAGNSTSILPVELFDEYDSDSRPEWLSAMLASHDWWVGNCAQPLPGNYTGNDVMVTVSSVRGGVVACSVQELTTGEVYVGELSEDEFEALARTQRLKQS